MSDSDQESIQDRGDSNSSDSPSIDGYDDEGPADDEDDLSHHDSEEETEVSLIEGIEEGFRVVEDKKFIDKLKAEENLQPVPKDKRCTLDCISKYEYARVIGMRAMQIASNSPLYLDDPIQALKGLSAIEIAEREFKAKRLPFTIRRVLPNGTYEDWALYELENKNI